MRENGHGCSYRIVGPYCFFWRRHHFDGDEHVAAEVEVAQKEPEDEDQVDRTIQEQGIIPIA